MTHKGTKTCAAAAIGILIAGCGGGGGSSSGDADNTGGTSVTSGAITAFGSIVVNGRRFETEGPGVEIEQDGDDVAESELELGMLVRVDEDDDGRRIEVDETVRGPVDGISAPQLTVMGQTVLTGPETVFDDSPASDLASLSVGDVVEVAGLRDGSGAIRATHVEKKTGTDEYKLTGRVANHDTGALTFDIAGLEIDYQGATLDDLPGGDWNGLVVEVEDEATTYAPGAGTLVATGVEREDETGSEAGAEIELERLVTAVNGDGTFEIGGGLLVRAGNAAFEYGSLSDLVVGLRVEVEGVLLDDGSIRATEVELDDNSARIAGIVDTVDPGAGTLTVLGVTVRLADDVEFDDFGTLGDLDAGSDFVEVEGRIAPGGAVIAHEIEREDDDDHDRELRGTVSNPDAASGTLELLGVAVSADGATEFEGSDDRALSRSAFFGRLVPGATVVEAKWDGDGFAGTGDPVDDLSIEDDDRDDHEDRDGDDGDDDRDDD